MHVEERHPPADPPPVDLGALARVADEHRPTQNQSGRAHEVEAAGEGDVVGQALRAVLPSLADALRAEAGAAEPGHDVGPPLEAAALAE